MAKCIIPGNVEIYDIDASFKKNGYIDWSQGIYTYEVEDTVYIYCSKPIQKVMYKTKVEKVNMSLSECNYEKEFFKNPEDYENSKNGPFFRLRFLEKVDKEELSYENLLKNGLNGVILKKKTLEGNLEEYIEKYFNGEEFTSQDIERSARIIKCYLEKNNLGNFEQEIFEDAIKSFKIKFSPEILEKLEGKDLLYTIFFQKGDKNSLCYYLEYFDEYKIFGKFGSYSGYGYYLFKYQNKVWRIGSSPKHTDISEDEAIKIGTKIRDAIVNGAKYIENAKLETIEDYKTLESELYEIFKDSNVNPTNGWIHKYYTLIFPDKFVTWHSEEGKEHYLSIFNLLPEEGYYAKDGQLRLLSEKAGIKLYSLMNERIEALFEEGKGSDIKVFASNLPRNLIYFGAPGTGKSYNLNEDKDNKLKITEDDYERVTFHPDYSYANFVGTYKPVPKKDKKGDDTISYEYVPGPFMRSLINAYKNPEKPFLLIIEEINRSNVAAVFGEVFQLLDRDKNNESMYPIETTEDMRKYLEKELKESIECDEHFGNYIKRLLNDDFSKISIPSNMFIWATMNSADQGVFPMDTAFKRRWDFKYFGINKDDDKIKHIKVNLNGRKISWNDLRKAINDELLTYKINEDKLLGPFFAFNEYLEVREFEQIPDDEFEQIFKEIFKNKIIMYLFEDVARAKRNELFEGARDGDKNVIYSEIRKKFDEKDIDIFCKNIRNTFPNENEYES